MQLWHNILLHQWAPMHSTSPLQQSHQHNAYDAILLISFGGPEGPDDVGPFLENVVRGKNIPTSRLQEVAAHYAMFDGVSPLNAQARALLSSFIAELNAHGPPLPVYWGNRHWHPLLSDAVRDMAEDGIQRALAFVTSAFGSPAGCREYREAIERARQAVGSAAPHIDKLRLFYNHPGFIETVAEHAFSECEKIPAEERDRTRLIFTAHSLPFETAQHCPYERQLREACRFVAEQLSVSAEAARERASPLSWDLVYQSRSGPPSQAWLGPEIHDHLGQLHREGNVANVIVVPIGFVLENLEVAYDLDVEVSRRCHELGLRMLRAKVAGNHPRFVRMIRELIAERLDGAVPRLALGSDGPWPDLCPDRCCV